MVVRDDHRQYPGVLWQSWFMLPSPDSFDFFVEQTEGPTTLITRCFLQKETLQPVD